MVKARSGGRMRQEQESKKVEEKRGQNGRREVKRSGGRSGERLGNIKAEKGT